MNRTKATWAAVLVVTGVAFLAVWFTRQEANQARIERENRETRQAVERIQVWAQEARSSPLSPPVHRNSLPSLELPSLTLSNRLKLPSLELKLPPLTLSRQPARRNWRQEESEQEK